MPDMTEQHATTQWAKAALKTRQLPAALLCLHPDASHTYAWVTQWVKGLRCEVSPEQFGGCGTCADCRWIQANTHPDIMTLSPHTPLEEAVTLQDKVPSLKVAHMNHILQAWMKTSPHWRVVLVCHSRMLPKTGTGQDLDTLGVSHHDYYTPLRCEATTDIASGATAPQEESMSWVPEALTRQSFPPQLADRLLKTLEQPPEKTLFIFIAQDTSQLLPTIVSRCVSLWLPSTLPPLTSACPSPTLLSEVSLTSSIDPSIETVWYPRLTPYWHRVITQESATRLSSEVCHDLTQAYHAFVTESTSHNMTLATNPQAETEATSTLVDKETKTPRKTKGKGQEVSSAKKTSPKKTTTIQEVHLLAWLTLLQRSMTHTLHQHAQSPEYLSYQARHRADKLLKHVMAAIRMLHRYVSPELVYADLWHNLAF
jgi:hypothetical protein